MQLRALKSCEYHALFMLMTKEKSPHTPKHFHEAEAFFEGCICYGKFSGKRQLEAAFILGDVTNENAFLDVVCRQDKRGKWASKKTLKWLMRLIFNDMSLDYIWVNPRREESLRMATKFGFQYVYGLDDISPVTMVLSRHNVSTRYLN
ncbi:MAG: hypothetical protein ACI9TY_001788 [Alphaproteobacteria bacterium]|jgi:hypothetical protein